MKDKILYRSLPGGSRDIRVQLVASPATPFTWEDVLPQGGVADCAAGSVAIPAHATKDSPTGEPPVAAAPPQTFVQYSFGVARYPIPDAGRAGLWSKVATRRTWDADSGRPIAVCNVVGMSDKVLRRSLPGGVHDVRVEYEASPDTPFTWDDFDTHAPAIPVRHLTVAHRRKANGWLTFDAAVARPVNRAELKTNADARTSMETEVGKLANRGVWDVKGVREWAKVCEEAKRKGQKAHVGNVFGICVEKNAELPKSDKRRKFKGRYVYQGGCLVGCVVFLLLAHCVYCLCNVSIACLMCLLLVPCLLCSSNVFIDFASLFPPKPLLAHANSREGERANEQKSKRFIFSHTGTNKEGSGHCMLQIANTRKDKRTKIMKSERGEAIVRTAYLFRAHLCGGVHPLKQL